MNLDQQTAAPQTRAYHGVSEMMSAPKPMSAFTAASMELDKSVMETMALASELADRLSPILRSPEAIPDKEKGVDANSVHSNIVESTYGQRFRVMAIRAQLQDLLNRVEV